MSAHLDECQRSRDDKDRVSELLESDREQLVLFKEHNMKLQARIHELEAQLDYWWNMAHTDYSNALEGRIARAEAVLRDAHLDNYYGDGPYPTKLALAFLEGR